MHGLLRSLRLFAVFGTAVALLVVVGAQSALAAETKSFTAVKTCTPLLPTTPPTINCVINPSTLKILRGATSHYLDIVFYDTSGQPVARSSATYLASPMLLTAIDERASTANGRCTFFIAGPKAGTGHCEWWSGTGRLAGFQSRWVIGTLAPHVYSIAGTYQFDRDADGGDD
jgi:hypothetical protein